MCLGLCYVRSCGPNEVMVKSGWYLGNKEPKFIRGGTTYVITGLQQVQKMSLNTMTIQIHSKSKYKLFPSKPSVEKFNQE